MAEPAGRKVWSLNTERIVTWVVLLVVVLIVAIIALAFRRLRG
jgi:hypothetical protein